MFPRNDEYKKPKGHLRKLMENLKETTHTGPSQDFVVQEKPYKCISIGESL